MRVSRVTHRCGTGHRAGLTGCRPRDSFPALRCSRLTFRLRRPSTSRFRAAGTSSSSSDLAPTGVFGTLSRDTGARSRRDEDGRPKRVEHRAAALLTGVTDIRQGRNLAGKVGRLERRGPAMPAR